MKKSTTKNFRVVIYPRTHLYGIRIDDEKPACDRILAAVSRHVDDVVSAYIEYDTEHTCEHCGSIWSEDVDTYNGGCCDQDERFHGES